MIELGSCTPQAQEEAYPVVRSVDRTLLYMIELIFQECLRKSPCFFSRARSVYVCSDYRKQWHASRALQMADCAALVLVLVLVFLL